MPVVQERVSPVIYVAVSARELPGDVQDWLGRSETRAIASPHIYDLLAQLVRGKRFAAIIVSIQAVDWNEMEFFDLAARLAHHTPIYVAGLYQTRAKLEAACRRGARLFDPVGLAEASAAAAGMSALSPERIAHVPIFPPVPVAVEPPPTDRIEPQVERVVSKEAHDVVPQGLAPEATDIPADAVDEPAAPTVSAIQLPAAIEPRPEVRQAFRLAPDSFEDREERPVVFPWTVNPNRPRRTPPKPATSGVATPSEESPSGPADAQAGKSTPMRSVRLTPEEIAALMEKLPRRDSASEAQP